MDFTINTLEMLKTLIRSRTIDTGDKSDGSARHSASYRVIAFSKFPGKKKKWNFVSFRHFRLLEVPFLRNLCKISPNTYFKNNKKHIVINYVVVKGKQL